MKLNGETDPTGGDGYVRGAWDEVMSAFMDGHISEEAYELLARAIRSDTTRTMLTYECDKGCGFYKNAYMDAGDTCRLVGCGGTIVEIKWIPVSDE
jgi:hypothetical protein